MHLIVNISELQYEAIMKSKVLKDVKADYIRNAIVLPKGHGDLIDKNKLLYKLKNSYLDTFGTERVMSVLSELPIIIEADKGE